MKLLLVLAGLALFLTGLLAGWLCPSLRSLPFNSQIDPGAVLGAIATLFSAAATLAVVYLVNYVYTSQMSSRKADTDLVLEVVREVRVGCAFLKECSVPCHTAKKLTKAEQDKLIQAEREVSNLVVTLENAIAVCGTGGDRGLRRIGLEKLKDARSALKDSMTDSPFPGPYDGAAKSRIALAFRDFRDELNRVSFAIIRR